MKATLILWLALLSCVAVSIHCKALKSGAKNADQARKHAAESLLASGSEPETAPLGEPCKCDCDGKKRSAKCQKPSGVSKKDCNRCSKNANCTDENNKKRCDCTSVVRQGGRHRIERRAANATHQGCKELQKKSGTPACSELQTPIQCQVMARGNPLLLTRKKGSSKKCCCCHDCCHDCCCHDCCCHDCGCHDCGCHDCCCCCEPCCCCHECCCCEPCCCHECCCCEPCCCCHCCHCCPCCHCCHCCKKSKGAKNSLPLKSLNLDKIKLG